MAVLPPQCRYQGFLFVRVGGWFRGRRQRRRRGLSLPSVFVSGSSNGGPHGLDVGFVPVLLPLRLHDKGSRRALPVWRCRCDQGPLPQDFSHISSGARPRWERDAQKYFFLWGDLLYWVTRCHPWGDTLSGLSRLGLVH